MNNKKRMEAAERRRRRAAALLDAGLSQSDVSRRVGASRQSVSRWARLCDVGGLEALNRAPRFGRKPRLSAAQRVGISRMLKSSPMAVSIASLEWTPTYLRQAIRWRFGIQLGRTTIWRL